MDFFEFKFPMLLSGFLVFMIFQNISEFNKEIRQQDQARCDLAGDIYREEIDNSKMNLFALASESTEVDALKKADALLKEKFFNLLAGAPSLDLKARKEFQRVFSREVPILGLPINDSEVTERCGKQIGMVSFDYARFKEQLLSWTKEIQKDDEVMGDSVQEFTKAMKATLLFVTRYETGSRPFASS